MRMILRSICAYFCSLVVAATILASWAAASEAVQTTFTADSHTTALYLFREGSGTTSANELGGGKPINVNNATWVPGRQYYALATDTGQESNSSYAYVVERSVESPASRHDRGGLG